MKIENIESFTITKQPLPLTLLPNEEIQKIRNAKSLGIYVYIMSRTENSFLEQEIADHFNLPLPEIEECLKHLDELGLLKFNSESAI